jgi:putative addiction module component (TIGR02574 family)
MSEIEKEIEKLSTAEKIILVENIWNSIADKHSHSLTEEQKTELDKRLQLIDSGQATFLSLEEIKLRFNAMK